MQMVCIEEFLLRDRPDKELHKAIQNIERRIGGHILLYRILETLFLK